jgi:CheY-like chemotaxis protein
LAEADALCILLVEDDPGDVLIMQEALEQSKLLHDLHHVADGEAALRFLRREEGNDGPRPDLILLDLNLPRVSGVEVLTTIKSDPDLASIPVVVLSTSQAEDDIVKTYALHANAYVSKPVDFDAFAKIVRQIDEFFFTVVRLPRNGG